MSDQERATKGPVFSDSRIIITISVFIILAIALVSLFYLSNKTLSATYAYVKGEGHWSKAQKQAVIRLYDYILTKETASYHQFKNYLDVTEGDRSARRALAQSNPDYKQARRGFLKGNNHPKDIPDMIWLYKYFHDYYLLEQAINIWKKADQKIDKLQRLGKKVHLQISENRFSSSRQSEALQQLRRIDRQLTDLEKAFSAHIARSARQINQYTFWSIIILATLILTITCYVIYRIMYNFKVLQEKLRESKSKLGRVLDNSRDIIYEQNLKKGKYEFVSGAAESLLGYTSEEIMQKGPEFIYDLVHPDDRDRVLGKMDQIQQGETDAGSVLDTEYRIQTRDGSYIWVNNYRKLIRRQNEREPSLVVGNVRDISERKTKEQQLDESLKEKQILLSEIHHRVKNNLAVISGILMLQSEVLKDPKVKSIFMECQNRINSIAEVHELLYESENFSEIDLESYLRNLVNRVIQNTTSNDFEIDYNLHVDVSHLELSKAVHFGLLINELVTNSIKHAFPNRTNGKLDLKLSEKNGDIEVSYRDNGIGMEAIDPFKEDTKYSNSIGLQLIKTLLKQLNAEHEFKAQDGFHLDFRF